MRLSKELIISNLVRLQKTAIARLPNRSHEDLVYANTGLLIKEFSTLFDRLDANFKQSNHAMPFVENILMYYSKNVTRPMLTLLTDIQEVQMESVPAILHPKILLFVR